VNSRPEHINAAASKIVVHGDRLRPGLLALSDVEAQPKR
jgi:hypothetical protein